MKQKEINPRLGQVGGQAVLEGVMMKAGTKCATACRLADGSITVHHDTFVSVRKKHKICNLPLVRGVVNFVEMLMLSMKTLNVSAEAMGEEMGEETKFEKWLREKLHIDAMAVATVIGMVLGILLSVGLFIFLPRFCADLIETIFRTELGSVVKGVVEGIAKVMIFVGYLFFCSLLKDMRRVFAYHGAEHKSVACYESGEELTPANAKRHTRFHPRCGTSFMFVMILLGIFMSVMINVLIEKYAPGDKNMGQTLLYLGIKLLTLPLVMGLGFEFIMFAGKHDNFLVRALSAPGLWMQRITTKEPDEQMLEVAITALKCAMPEVFPDFDPATYDRSPKPAEQENEAEGTDASQEDGVSEADAVQEASAEEAQESTSEDETV